MRIKCRSCLCRTCVYSCFCKMCSGTVSECKKHIGFEQLSIFNMPSRYRKAPRHSWEYYGISKERHRELTDMIRSKEYATLAFSVALRTNGMIAEYILLSIIENRSYEGVEYAEGLGRIPCGRTDFYGWRRYFYHLFDLELRRIGK